MAKPIPVAPPVTIAHLPRSSRSAASPMQKIDFDHYDLLAISAQGARIEQEVRQLDRK
jgi:hypothetical protein